MVRPGFFDHSPMEKERIGPGEDIVIIPKLHADGASHILEFAGLALQVVCASGGFDVLIIRATLEYDATFGLGVSRILVISNPIRREPVHSIKNSDFAL